MVKIYANQAVMLHTYSSRHFSLHFIFSRSDFTFGTCLRYQLHQFIQLNGVSNNQDGFGSSPARFSRNGSQNWVNLFLIIFLVSDADSEDDEVIKSVADLMGQLSSGNEQWNLSWGWNTSSDPCTDGWIGVNCDNKNISLRKIVLNELNLVGTINFTILCEAKSLSVLSWEGNQIVGDIT